MTCQWQASWLSRLALAALVAILPAVALAAPKATSKAAKSKLDAVPATEPVDVFEAMKNKDIEVKFIALDPNKANLVIENKTKKPLTIKLPDAFAGMPVLGQTAGTDANQGLGAGGGGGGGGPFNIAPEKTRKIEIPCLCLEHGKPDPYAKVPYEIKPLSAISDKPEVAALIARYGKGDVSVQAAQAAAWHLQNGMSWNELEMKRIEHARGPSEPYFSRKDLAEAKKLSTDAIAVAKAQSRESQGSASTGDSASSYRAN